MGRGRGVGGGGGGAGGEKEEEKGECTNQCSGKAVLAEHVVVDELLKGGHRSQSEDCSGEPGTTEGGTQERVVRSRSNTQERRREVKRLKQQRRRRKALNADVDPSKENGELNELSELNVEHLEPKAKAASNPAKLRSVYRAAGHSPALPSFLIAQPDSESDDRDNQFEVSGPTKRMIK